TAYLARHSGLAPQWQPVRVQYADFAGWQVERLDMPDSSGRTERARQLDYWRERLAGAPEVIDLPADRPRPSVPSHDGAVVEFEIPAGVISELQSLGRSHNATLFMVTHAAFAMLLARLGGGTEVVVGTPYAGRTEAVLDDVVGMFVNTLAMRSSIRPGEPFSEFLERVRTEDLADMAHAEASFDSIANAVGAPRSGAFNPVFQVMFTFQNLEFPTVALDDLTISPVSEELTAAKVDLDLTLFPNDPAALGAVTAEAPLRARFLYSTDLFDEATVRTYAERYVRLLESIVADPDVLVGELSIATEAELGVIEETAAERSLAELVTTAAAVSPEAVAVVDGDAEISFALLSVTASAMAAALPDPDAALTTALLSLVPQVAAAGPVRLGEVLGELRQRASAAHQTTPDNDEESVPRT
ncbi:MAG: condensation domain-containing protein, partial [Gordonia sp. (in: high G+C Gram-positive bacteria)]